MADRDIRSKKRNRFLAVIPAGFLIFSACSAPVPVISSMTPPGAGRDLVHHEVKVTIIPSENRLTAEDNITLPDDFPGVMEGSIRFFLHEDLRPSSPADGVSVSMEQEAKEVGPPGEYYRMTFPPGRKSFLLRYGGKIDHPLQQVGEEYARGQKETYGSISTEGIYLSGTSAWYPEVGDGLFVFDLEVTLPGGWDAVSQGARTVHVVEEDYTRVRWKSAEPQDSIFLAGGRYTEYTTDAGTARAMVFLREPDDQLASRYLEATARYIGMYEELIGPYPYGKFALVENFWETGYGMPSFTLMGPRVIRFPFIINSSYPHEILHNYWGNSVYIDYGRGNWGEGLTAYLSDHLIKEQMGSGVENRQTTLQKYSDYVLSGRDLPLTSFRSRHGSVTEAVGYGKSMMLFHMLRLELGDDVFRDCLRKLYRENIYRTVAFDDLRIVFEDLSGRDLGYFFEQWTSRPGAPELFLKEADYRPDEDGFLLTATLEQVQAGDPFRIRVPLAVTLEGRDEAHQVTFEMNGRRLEVETRLPARPLRLDVDPEYDIFRRLHREETPPALSQAFGAEKALILLPSEADGDILDAYGDLAAVLSRTGPGEVNTAPDSDVDDLPPDSSVWLFGWENRHLEALLSSLDSSKADLESADVRLERTRLPREDHSFVLTARHPGNPDLALLWVAVDNPKAVPGLGRKLPHYHKYSYLGFEGDEPANVAKGRWPTTDSPMTMLMAPTPGHQLMPDIGKLAPRKALADLPPLFSKSRMMKTVEYLSSWEMKGRGFGTTELDEAADYIASEFSRAGLEPAGGTEGGFFQTWTERGGDPEREANMKNVLGIIRGKDEKPGAGSVIIGAHYDHLGLGWPDHRKGNKGKVHPGADDNASGVAVLIELARVLSERLSPDRTVVFAAFTGEDAGRLGSKHYLDVMGPSPEENIFAMINLDTIGRLGDKKLMVLGGGSAREWVHIFRGTGFVTGVEIEMVSEELDAGDQVSFDEHGIPAVQLFTGPHFDYHRPTDTADKIDPPGLVKVASVAKEVVEYLAGSDAALTSPAGRGRAAGVDAVGRDPSAARKVGLGTVPDFSYSGEGVLLTDVVPGSPAEKAGIRGGDIIIDLGGQKTDDLKSFSEALKSFSPGDRVPVTLKRENRVMTLEATIETR